MTTTFWITSDHETATTGFYSGGYEEVLSPSGWGSSAVEILPGTDYEVMLGAGSSNTLVTQWYSPAVGVSASISAATWDCDIYAAMGTAAVWYFRLLIIHRAANGTETTLGTGSWVGASSYVESMAADVSCSSASLAVGDRLSVRLEAYGAEGHFHTGDKAKYTDVTRVLIKPDPGNPATWYYQNFTSYSTIVCPTTLTFIDHAVTKDASLAWNTVGSVVKDAEMLWNVTKRIESDVSLAWGIYSNVVKDADLQWHVYTKVPEKALTIAWHVESNLYAIAKDADIQWYTYGNVNKDGTIHWMTQIGLLQSVVTMELALEKYTDLGHELGKNTNPILEVEA